MPDAAPAASSARLIDAMGEGATALMYACQQARDREVRDILAAKPEAALERDRTGKSALHYCAENATAACADAVLRAAPQLLDAADEDGYTPLHLAVIAGNAALVRHLLAAGADVHCRDLEQHSVVHWATVCGEVEALDIVLHAGAPASSADVHGGFPVHYAAQMCGPHSEMGHDVRFGLAVLRRLLRAPGLDVNVRDRDGRQPILWAASADHTFPLNRGYLKPFNSVHCPVCCYFSGNKIFVSSPPFVIATSVSKATSNQIEAVKYTKQSIHVDVDGQQDNEGSVFGNLTTDFLSRGSADAILALVNAGANVEAEDKDGLTALHCAASRGHTDCLETLLTLCGAQADVMDSHGCTALFYAATLGHADATRLLLSHGADPNRQDRKGRTPAHCGAAKGQLETLRLLAAHGAALWLRNVRGDLPLHDAVASGRTPLVRWLLALRPDAVDAPNNDGRCPLHVAAIHNNVEMCKVVMDHGALLNPVMRSGRGAMMTPLDAALHRGNRGVAKYLQLHGGVPAARLTDKAARLRGTSQQHRAAASETPGSEVRFAGTPECLVQPRLGASLAASPLAAHTELPRADSRALQVRLSDEVSVRHVERLVPVCAHDHCHCRRRASSSEDEQRPRRAHQRRRRRPHSPAPAAQTSDDGGCGSPSDRRHRHRDADGQRRRHRARAHRDSDEHSDAGRRRQKRRTSGDRHGRKRQPQPQGRSSSSGGSSAGSVGGGEERGRRRHGHGQGQARRSATAPASASPSASDSGDSGRRGGRRRRHGEQRGRAGSASEGADQGGEAEEAAEGEAAGADDDDDDDVQVCVGRREEPRRRAKPAAPAARGAREDRKGRAKPTDLAVVQEEEVKKRTALQSSVEGKSAKKKGDSATSASNGDATKSEAKKANAKVRIAEEQTKTLAKAIGEDAEDTNTSSSTTVARELLKAISTEKSVTSIDDEVAPGEPPEEHPTEEVPLEEPPAEEAESAEGAECPDEGGGLGEEAVGNGEVAEPFVGLPKERTDSVYTTSLDEGATQQVVTAIVHHEPADDSERTSLQPSELEADQAPPDQEEPAAPEAQHHSSEASGNGQDGDADASTIDRKPSIVKQEKIDDSTANGNGGTAEEDAGGDEEADIPTADTKMSESVDQDEQPAEEKTAEEEPAEDQSLKGEADDDGSKSETENGVDEKRHDVSEAGSGVVGESRKDVSRADDEASGADAAGEEEDGEGEDEGAAAADASQATGASSGLLEGGGARRQSTLSAAGDLPSEEEAPQGLSRASSASTLPAKESLEKSEEESEGDDGHEQEEVEAEDDVEKGEEEEEEDDDEEEEEEEASTTTTRSRSSAQRDSGFEPSPRRDQDQAGEADGGGGGGGGRVPRPCREAGRPPLSTVSVTQAVQNSMRKYHMERRIFQQLLELKRLQIRAGRANEQVLVKRLVDDYRRAGLIVGLKGFQGPFTFRAFEKYLYDQLRTLQSAERRLVPRLKSSDDLEKLSAVLRRAKLNNLLPPDDPALCTRGTHRCHHAAHAYTGVPCAAYIAPRLNHHQLPKAAPTHFLPRIHTGTAPGGGRTVGTAKAATGRAVTLELGAGGRHVIALPAERGRDKRYYVSFTIKGAGGGGGPGEVGAAPDQEDGRHRHAKSL